jgi:hypothetical protein
MIARASGALASAPWPPMAIGIRARTVDNEVIRIGRSRTRAASLIASVTEPT